MHHSVIRTLFSIFVFGTSLVPLKVRAQEIAPSEQLPPGMIYVEPTFVQATSESGMFELVPYKERRPRWGVTFGVTYSLFEPVNYEPNFIDLDFDEVYSTSESPLIEAQFTIKRNLGFGSIGVEISGGYYKNTGKSDVVGEDFSLDLTLIPVRLGATVALDTLLKEPYLVPYGSLGAYTIWYTEDLSGNSFTGNTQVAPYVSAGFMVQLDWIDRAGARRSYEDSGIESTFLFVEGRKFFTSEVASDPDFETDFHANGGLRVEF